MSDEGGLVPEVLPARKRNGGALWRDPERSLTKQERRFVEEYCGQARGSARAAIERMGYASSSANAMAARFLKRPAVQRAIDRRVREDCGVSAAEVLARLKDMMRAPELLADCYTMVREEVPGFDENGDPKYEWRPVLDWGKVHEAGLERLIVGFDPQGRPRIADPLAAAKILAEITGLRRVEKNTFVQNNVLNVRQKLEGKSLEELRHYQATGRWPD